MSIAQIFKRKVGFIDKIFSKKQFFLFANFVLQQRSKSSTIQNRVQNIRKCLQKVNYA